MLHGIEERTQPIPAKTYPFQVLWASGADKGKVAVRGGFVDYTSSDGTLYRIALATTTGLPDDTTALFTSNNYIRLDLDMSSESPGDWTLTAEAASAAHTTEADHFNWILARDISSVPGTDKAVLETHWAGGNIMLKDSIAPPVYDGISINANDADEWQLFDWKTAAEDAAIAGADLIPFKDDTDDSLQYLSYSSLLDGVEAYCRGRHDGAYWYHPTVLHSELDFTLSAELGVGQSAGNTDQDDSYWHAYNDASGEVGHATFVDGKTYHTTGEVHADDFALQDHPSTNIWNGANHYVSVSGDGYFKTGSDLTLQINTGDGTGGGDLYLLDDEASGDVNIGTHAQPWDMVYVWHSTEMYVAGAGVINIINASTPAAAPELKMDGTKVLTEQQTGMGATLSADTAGATYTSDEQGMLQAVYDKMVDLETKLKLHGLIAD